MMMWVQTSWSSNGGGALQFFKPNNFLNLKPTRKRRPSSSTFVCLKFGTDVITEIANNKVIVAAAVSAAIGQISKPFTSVLLYGEKFEINIDTAFRAGGFPSAHSSAVVATATALGLQRGFLDPIFGLAVVYAGITMYDAQGVRREVGIHAKQFNKFLLKRPGNSSPSNDASDLVSPSGKSSSSSSIEMLDSLASDESSAFRSENTRASLLLTSDDRTSQNNPTFISSNLSKDVQGESSHMYAQLRESVGHTPVEVLAGAILGFVVSVIVHTL